MKIMNNGSNIELRVPDDYCQGESSILYPLEDDEFYEEDRVKKRLRITPRGKSDR